MPIKAVLWDIDGTLALSEELHFESLVEVSERYGAKIGRKTKEQCIGQAAHVVHRYLSAETDMDVDFDTWAAARLAYYRNHSAAISPRPGALAVWRAIENRGIRQALVSNSDRLVVEVNIAVLGLDRPSLTSVARNDVREGKPDPEPYQRAAYLLAVEPSECIAVEDSPLGAAAALAAGMETVVWPEGRAFQFPATAVQINNIEQLIDMLDTR